ncbi:hypothetical protein EYF80_053849 [Liparis tanakae]|uniref:Uncharacterized protein n=1 Tax=Liparis tanakae TaxID=230148 RepID=A0A4Z2F4C3_9TELE|nr:hypothetical protein EYF80_053849 [Liparis tanakae]
MASKLSRVRNRLSSLWRLVERGGDPLRDEPVQVDGAAEQLRTTRRWVSEAEWAGLGVGGAKGPTCTWRCFSSVS